MELSDFLLAMFAEDEAAIKGRDMSRPIHFVGCYYYEHTLDANLYCDCDEDGAASRRYLAECDAKRRIVVRCQEMLSSAVPMAVHLAQQTLADLGRPLADHPDFREEWRP